DLRPPLRDVLRQHVGAALEMRFVAEFDPPELPLLRRQIDRPVPRIPGGRVYVGRGKPEDPREGDPPPPQALREARVPAARRSADGSLGGSARRGQEHGSYSVHGRRGAQLPGASAVAGAHGPTVSDTFSSRNRVAMSAAIAPPNTTAPTAAMIPMRARGPRTRRRRSFIP